MGVCITQIQNENLANTPLMNTYRGEEVYLTTNTSLQDYVMAKYVLHISLKKRVYNYWFFDQELPLYYMRYHFWTLSHIIYNIGFCFTTTVLYAISLSDYLCIIYDVGCQC